MDDLLQKDKLTCSAILAVVVSSKVCSHYASPVAPLSLSAPSCGHFQSSSLDMIFSLIEPVMGSLDFFVFCFKRKVFFFFLSFFGLDPRAAQSKSRNKCRVGGDSVAGPSPFVM